MTNSTSEREQRLNLPEWTDCQSAFADGTATSLTEFIRAYEPVESTDSSDTAAQVWRQSLSDVINDAAISMRDLCVEKLRRLLEREVNGHSRSAYQRAIVEMQSLTLDNQEPVKEEAACCISALLHSRQKAERERKT